jgi:hypothetical protein
VGASLPRRRTGDERDPPFQISGNSSVHAYQERIWRTKYSATMSMN